MHIQMQRILAGVLFLINLGLVYSECQDPCVDCYDEIIKHLKDRETFATTGYVPTTNSGCTIGLGIDLGQQSKDGLKNKGISDELIAKLEKYLGAQTQAQLDEKGLKCSDLVLTEDEAKALSMPFVSEACTKVKPYAEKMDCKGLATLISLRHWAGSLGCTNCKLSIDVNGVDTNYVWDAIKGKTATNEDLKAALEKTLPGKTVGTATYNRIKHEIDYLK